MSVFLLFSGARKGVSSVSCAESGQQSVENLTNCFESLLELFINAKRGLLMGETGIFSPVEFRKSL